LSSAEARRQPHSKCCTRFIHIKPLAGRNDLRLKNDQIADRATIDLVGIPPGVRRYVAAGLSKGYGPASRNSSFARLAAEQSLTLGELVEFVAPLSLPGVEDEVVKALSLSRAELMESVGQGT
jgi:hypothetical protein